MYEVCTKLAVKTPGQPFYCYLWTDFKLVFEDGNNARGATLLNCTVNIY